MNRPRSFSPSPTQILLGDIHIQVERKLIKNINLRVTLPDAVVIVSAPMGLDMAKIEAFVKSKRGWILNQQQRIKALPEMAPPTLQEPAQPHLWGQVYQLTIVEKAAAPRAKIDQGQIILQIRPGASATQKQQMLDAVYEQQIQKALPPLLAKWQARMGVKAASVTIRKMKTRWGSCSIGARTIRLNLELAKRPPECLEYVLVHELAHLLEASHGSKFIALMDKYLPQWRLIKTELNQLPPP
jgi:predicted metal-dependent hydrolase